MPTVVRGENGKILVDERQTLEEWLEEKYGAGVRVEGLTLSGDNIIATISHANSNFPNENVAIKFVEVPDDVTFNLKQGTGGEFVKSYVANREISGNKVFVKRSDGKHTATHELDPSFSSLLVRHFPGAFEWGYAGSGPSQLAFAILLDACDSEVAERHYQDFKNRVIAGLPAGEWELLDSEVRSWIENAEKGVLL